MAVVSLALAMFGYGGAAMADRDHDHGNENPQPCPVTPYDGITPMDVEFQGDAQAITQCLRVRNHAKVVISVSHPFMVNAFGQPQTARATFLANLDHLVRNYENVHGMTVGKDVDVVVVLVESGGILASKRHPLFAQAYGNNPPNPSDPQANPFIPLLEQAMQKGIRFYLCQTAARNLGIKMPNMIPGVKFVPGGHIAVADFQMRGYALIQP
jgi:intracellular sulfur oxidation DsrE/DsrF family protein